MVNTDDFIKRLETILDYYSLSASLFADKLGVQRSGLSHLLSGRNKPSLDFVMKLTENFPEVDLYWLLNGTGAFPKNEERKIATTQVPVSDPMPSPAPPSVKESVNADLFSQTEESEPLSKDRAENRKSNEEKKTEKIVIFYSDGTFQEYIPEN